MVSASTRAAAVSILNCSTLRSTSSGSITLQRGTGRQKRRSDPHCMKVSSFARAFRADASETLQNAPKRVTSQSGQSAVANTVPTYVHNMKPELISHHHTCLHNGIDRWCRNLRLAVGCGGHGGLVQLEGGEQRKQSKGLGNREKTTKKVEVRTKQTTFRSFRGTTGEQNTRPAPCYAIQGKPCTESRYVCVVCVRVCLCCMCVTYILQRSAVNLSAIIVLAPATRQSVLITTELAERESHPNAHRKEGVRT